MHFGKSLPALSPFAYPEMWLMTAGPGVLEGSVTSTEMHFMNTLFHSSIAGKQEGLMLDHTWGVTLSLLSKQHKTPTALATRGTKPKGRSLFRKG